MSTSEGDDVTQVQPGVVQPGVVQPGVAFESRRRDRDGKRDAVLRAAVRLFLDHGYQHTTLSDVAKRLNITKPALYRYFPGKQDILFECWAAGFRTLVDRVEAIDAGDGTGLSRLRQMIAVYAELMATDFGASVVRFDMRDLTEASRSSVVAWRRQIDHTLRGYIADGVADGTIVSCDPKLAAFAIAGSLNWIGYWYRRGGSLTPAEIGAEFALRLTAGLIRQEERA